MNRLPRAREKNPTKVQGVIDNLLVERQELLVSFCRLAGVEPFSEQRAVTRLLQEFCQLLMDYTALGHFELLSRHAASELSPLRPGVLEKLYPKLTGTTTVAVAFNDKYDPSDHVLKLDDLAGDLSELGEGLAARIELEDRVIESMVE